MSLLGLLMSGGTAVSADDGADLFEKRIRPALVKHCYKCHSATAAEVKGGLRLDSRDATRKGGETGPAVVPGDVQQSLLMDAIRHESLEMPPDEKLPDGIIADFQRWIELGAPDPRDRPPTSGEAAQTSWKSVLATRRQWWSLQPVRDPALPEIQDADRSAHPVDRFILARLNEAGLEPGEPAAARTLIRRLSLVLTGLPPSPEEVQDFVARHAHQPDAAYEALVDRLLDSPHFGERWARHWMDVVRFTETHGNEWNYEVHHAWRYRDWLIRALNQDVPYDQFLREHIAGDLLANPRWNEQQKFNESVIGTAFFRFGEVNHDDCIGLRKIGFDIVDNQLDTLTKAFQATTVSCARCHDHKIDAVSMDDYYALLGILRSSRLVAHTIDAPSVNQAPMAQLRQLKAEIRTQLARRWIEEARDVAQYLLAAEAARQGATQAAQLAEGLHAERLEKWVEALKVDSPPMEHPLAPWLEIGDRVHAASASSRAAAADHVAEAWHKLAARYIAEHQSRQAAEGFDTFGDFRDGQLGRWRAGGHGLRGGATRSGDFALARDGDSLIKAVLPAGCFTHTLSEKLNGTLRSPILPQGKKNISFQVMGQHTSAVRLVSNNCQLNYKNYRALTTGTLQWISFPTPPDVDSLRVFAELMTKFDNPKFPDQLGTIGGDTKNDRVPWEEAAADPSSYFGITRVVMHDGADPPKPELSHLVNPLFESESAPPKTLADVAGRYATIVADAARAWGDDRAGDDEARWLDWLVGHDLLDNAAAPASPLAELVARYREIEKDELARPRIVPGVEDFDDGIEQALLAGGDCMKPRDPVKRRYLEVLARPGATFTPRGSGRLELAERIASPDNPLTARVMVNRVWHHLFGAGIVGSVDDFGQIGEAPSHPELLDHLAARFVERGWSIKRLIRYVVTSETFRMSSRAAPAANQTDPRNQLLHHYPARRMDAEAIRDCLLATSGRLDRTLHGMSIPAYREKANSDRRLFPGPLDGHGRRSVYTKASLMEGPKFLGTFNYPGGKVTQGRRDVTNVPAQALALLNDPFVIQQAGVWADRTAAGAPDSVAATIDRMFLRALGRPPAPDESQDFQRLVAQLAELHEIDADQVLASRDVWRDVAHVMFNLREFIYIP